MEDCWDVWGSAADQWWCGCKKQLYVVLWVWRETWCLWVDIRACFKLQLYCLFWWCNPHILNCIRLNSMACWFVNCCIEVQYKYLSSNFVRVICRILEPDVTFFFFFNICFRSNVGLKFTALRSSCMPPDWVVCPLTSQAPSELGVNFLLVTCVKISSPLKWPI